MSTQGTYIAGIGVDRNHAHHCGQIVVGLRLALQGSAERPAAGIARKVSSSRYSKYDITALKNLVNPLSLIR